MAKNVSQSMSFQGWNFGKWLKGNKEAVKLVISAAIALYVPTDPGIKVLIGAGTKLLLDSIDFFASEVEL